VIRVLVTRAKDQAEEFAALLRGHGFEPVVFPVIVFESLAGSPAVNNSLENIGSYEWLIFTSANGVNFFMQGMTVHGKSVKSLANLKICAVGPKTAQVAEEFGMNIDLIPEDYSAEGVLRSFECLDIKDSAIMLARAEKGNNVLPEGLKKMGAKVDLVAFYRTIKPVGKEEELKSLLHCGIDVITFTSGSTLDNFLAILGENSRDLLKGIKIACISSITAATAEKHGLKLEIIAGNNKTDSLASAIKKYYL